MNRETIQAELNRIFRDQFEMEDLDPDDDLRAVHEFDSIDAIELLREIEIMLGTPLTRQEKKMAMDIQSFGQIVDYVETLADSRASGLCGADPTPETAGR